MVEKVKIPKRVGPVKLSKKVRKKAKKAIEAAASPFVRDFATAAMAAASRARGEKRGDSPSEGKPYRMHSGTRVDVEGSKVVEAFRTAAVDGFRRFLEGFEEGLARPRPRRHRNPRNEAARQIQSGQAEAGHAAQAPRQPFVPGRCAGTGRISPEPAAKRAPIMAAGRR